jgi:hypothetical protein
MTCNNCYNPSCDSTCGCPQQVKGSCVFYQGANLTCLDVTKGDDYDSILASLNTIVCNLVAPTGIQTTLTGCGSITVTPTSSTNYNVCLSTATQTQINSNTSSIAFLSNCINTGVFNVVSTDGSVSIDITPSTGCGKTLDLSVPVPSGLPIVDGIIYSDSTKVEANAVVGGDQVLKSSGNNSNIDSIGYYQQTYGLNVGDEIRWRANGQVEGVGDLADQVKFDFFDGVTGIINGNIFGSFSLIGSWEMEATAIILDNTPGASEVLIDVKFFKYPSANSIVGNSGRDLYIFNQTISNIDLDTLEIRIKYVRNTTLGSYVNNFARQLVVEIRKFIS